MARPKITVATYLEQQLALCGKSQREVSQEIGYTNPNIMTMLKTGATKVPLNKVGLLAKSLGVDPAHMLRLVANEYMPETWGAIEEILGRENLMTSQDREVAAFVRQVAGDFSIDLTVEENRKILGDAVRAVVARDQTKAKAAVRRLDALPSNSRQRR